eukprot:8792913-Lingulodinium_polyedra.AAC.1
MLLEERPIHEHLLHTPHDTFVCGRFPAERGEVKLRSGNATPAAWTTRCKRQYHLPDRGRGLRLFW